MSYERHLIEQLTTEYHTLIPVPPPSSINFPVIFIGDGTGGTVNGNFYVQAVGGGLTDISSGAGGGVSGASNVGTGAAIFKDLSGSTLRFRTLIAGSGVTITPGTDDVTISSISSGSTSTETITTSGSTALDETKTMTFINIDTVGTVSGTLANGSTIGQEKKLLIESITSGGKYRANITNFVSIGSFIEFDTAGQSANLVWSSSGWILNGGSGGTVG